MVISHLARKLSRRHGFEMVITGREIDAEEGKAGRHGESRGRRRKP